MPPLAEAKEKTLLTALKTLTLMRSVAQAERGWRNGPEVDFVCRQIRLATDREIRNSEKLRVIYELTQFSADLPTYLAGLNSEATTSWEKERIGTSETVLQEFVRRIGNVAKNDLGTEPLSIAFTPSIARAPIPIPLSNSRNDKVLLEFEQYLEEFSEPSDHELEHDRADSIEIAEYSEPVTPELQYRIGKSFLQQTQADRNYLPYAWNRLRRDEIDTLQKHLGNWLNDYSKALLASFATISQLARSSIETACNIKIANKPAGSAWVLDLAGGRLLRQTMRPQSSSQSDTDRLDTQEKRAGWIRPLAESQSVALSKAVLAPLAAAMAANPDAGELGELWRSAEESPWTAFDKLCACTPGLERVTHGKLALTAEQIVFEKNGSGVMARMLLTPAHATKSPASWYPSWSLEQANAAFRGIAPDAVVSQADPLDAHNALGSEIDPIDERLHAEFEIVRRKLTEAMAGDTRISWVDFHNLVTTFSLATLFACTGARAVKSVFERAADFDLEAKRLFIDDKAVGYREQGRWGRLVPLPDLAIDVQKRLYLPYLRWLLGQLAQSGDHVLAPAIQAHLNTDSNAPLPYFFHLRLNSDDSVSIGEVSEAILCEANLFTWPLPWNLFRHRLSTRLRTLRLHEELVAAQLGHAESGESSYGDYSTRCWASDEEWWQRTLCKAIEPVNISIPEFHAHKLSFPTGSLTFRKGLDSFGSATRQRKRRAERLIAKRQARAYLQGQISDWMHKVLKEAPGNSGPESPVATDVAADKKNDDETLQKQSQLIATMDPDRWTELGHEMVTAANGMPRPNGPVWFEAYEELAEVILKRTGIRMRSRLASRRLHIERPAFHEESIGIGKRVAALRVKLDAAFSAAPPLSKMPHHMKETLLAFDLCLNSRVTDTRLLTRLTVKNRQRLMFHIRDDISYLALDTERTESDGLPFAWYLVPARSAALVPALQNAQSGGHESRTTRRLLLPLLELLGKAASVGNRDAWIGEMARLVDMENAIAWPGIAAGARSGRVRTSSVSKDQLVRVHLGKRLAKNDIEALRDDAATGSVEDAEDLEDEEEQDATALEESPDQLVQPAAPPYEFSFPYIEAGNAAGQESELLLRAARDAFKGFDDSIPKRSGARASVQAGVADELHAELVENTEQSTAADSNPKKKGLANRSDVAGKVHAALVRHSERSSAAVQLLVAWILELLSQKRPSGKWLKARSILRYLSALSVGFGDFGKDFDLINADEVDIEEFYDRVLRRPHISAKSTPKGEATRRLDERYTLARLIDFHRFAAREYGLDSPDWSALSSDLTGSLVSAHLISPAEYQHTLKLICPRSERFDRDALIDAFVLILAYRFGLRGAEAISMDRTDWVEVLKGVVVLVRGKHRKTKTYSGRRQVPLFGSFTEHERYVIDSWMKHWDLHSAHKSQGPLFFAEGAPKTPAAIHRHRASIVSALRAVTGSTSVTLHHARHSFANLLAQRLIFPELSKTLVGFSSNELWDAPDTAIQFLGSSNATRRAPWALAAALGHAHPKTTLTHYVHFNHDWGNELCLSQARKRFVTPAALRVKQEKLDLSRLPKDPTYLQELTPRPPLPVEPMTPQRVLDALRLCARGVSPETAAWQLGLSRASAHKLRAVFDELDFEQLTRKPRSHEGEKPPASQSKRLMANRSQKSWERVESTIGSNRMRSPAGLDAVEQIADARQLLVYTPQHLTNLDHFLESIGWEPKLDIEAYAPDGVGLTMQALAALHGLQVHPGRQKRFLEGASRVVGQGSEEMPKRRPGPKLRSEAPYEPPPVRREVQVEMAWIRIPNMLRRANVPDRLAIVPASSNDGGLTWAAPRLARPEFVLVWLAMQLGEASS